MSLFVVVPSPDPFQFLFLVAGGVNGAGLARLGPSGYTEYQDSGTKFETPAAVLWTGAADL